MASSPKDGLPINLYLCDRRALHSEPAASTLGQEDEGGGKVPATPLEAPQRCVLRSLSSVQTMI